MLSLAFLPIKAARVVIMGVCQLTVLELTKMQDQKLLTLCWHSFLGGGRDIITRLRAYKGGQYCDYGQMLAYSQVIIQDARPEIGDAPLTLISRMRKQACHWHF